MDSASDSCDDDEYQAENQRLFNLATGNCSRTPSIEALKIIIDSDGKVQAVLAPDAPMDNPTVLEIIDCLQNVLKDEEFPCLAGEEVPPIKLIA